MEDKKFLDDVVNKDIVIVIDAATKLLTARKPLPDIYNYILRNSKNCDGYITMFLFGVIYQKYKEDNNLR